jgi:hypothetical protein
LSGIHERDATHSIRQGLTRKVIERIKTTGDVFLGWSDRPWVLDDAAVRVPLIGFDDGAEKHRSLNGAEVPVINANLTFALDLTSAKRLLENAAVCFEGVKKYGASDINADVAQRLLRAVGNPNGRPNSDVVRPWVNGSDVTGQSQVDAPRVQAIAAAAADLVAKRDAWLNPTGASDGERRQRTLTNLYNARPVWRLLALNQARAGKQEV